MPFLPPNQQRQSTEGFICNEKIFVNYNAKWPGGVTGHWTRHSQGAS